jgi:hypothetical protein
MAKVTISEKYFLELVNRKAGEIESLRASEERAWNFLHESKKEFWQELQTLRAVQKEYEELKSKPTLFSNVSVEEIISNYLEEKFEGSVVIDGIRHPILKFQNVSSVNSEGGRDSFRMALVVFPGDWPDNYNERSPELPQMPDSYKEIIEHMDNKVFHTPTQDTDGADDIPSTVGGRPATDIQPYENHDW